MYQTRSGKKESLKVQKLSHPKATCSVVIPCLNEEIALPYVIRDVQAVLPNAEIWVYDNGSTDRTIEVALSLGASVRSVPLKGKGHALIQAFADLFTDYMIIVDGDATYDIKAAPKLLELASNQHLDMITCVREAVHEKDAYRLGHVLGNKCLTGLVRKFFPGQSPSDMLSGYRIFSRRYYKTFPFIIPGFEIETYLTVHALNLSMPTGEILTSYRARPEGSESKLRTYSDGMRVFLAIIRLILRERPFFLAAWLGGLIGIAGLGMGLSLLPHFIETGLVPRLPTAVLAASCVLCAFTILTCGVLMHYMSSGRREAIRIRYLGLENYR